MTGQHTRVRRSQALAVAIAAIALSGVTGCVTGREFREAAGPAFQTGVTAIVNGLLDGFFAVIEPDTNT
ncbi:MAG: hypothetical protein JSU86_11850 [Phycisphaerales bacterium]|nr:MAG: hypothetical protein JSU86_11850 [Phycisphaerales bacterium]